MTYTNRCVGSWGAIAVRDGQTESTGLSTISTVQVDGLDICQFSYVISGFIVTPGGVRGDTGAPNDLVPDFSGNAHHMPIGNDMLFYSRFFSCTFSS